MLSAKGTCRFGVHVLLPRSTETWRPALAISQFHKVQKKDSGLQRRWSVISEDDG